MRDAAVVPSVLARTCTHSYFGGKSRGHELGTEAVAEDHHRDIHRGQFHVSLISLIAKAVAWHQLRCPSWNRATSSLPLTQLQMAAPQSAQATKSVLAGQSGAPHGVLGPGAGPQPIPQPQQLNN